MMLQGMQNPVVEVGVITGKVAHDEELLAECERNANNASQAMFCFPGGSQPINHDIMQGYTLLGMRNVCIPESDIFEIGLASAAGLCWDKWCSQRAMESDFYWQGIANTEQRKTKPLDSTTSDPPNGVGTHRAGTKSIINNSWRTIFAGDRIAWCFPKAPFHPKSGRDNANLFNGGDPLNYLARQGEPPTQFRWEYESYDPSDFTLQMAGAFAALEADQGEGGVKGMPYQNALPWAAGGAGVKERPWSSLQEEALAYRFGLWGVALTLHDTLRKAGRGLVGMTGRQIAAELKLFEANPDKLVTAGIADVLLDRISPCDPARTAAVDAFEDAEARGGTGNVLHEARTFDCNPQTLATHADKFYANLRAHAIDMLAIGMTSALEDKRSKVVGVAMNSAAPADTLHVMFGHFAN